MQWENAFYAACADINRSLASDIRSVADELDLKVDEILPSTALNKNSENKDATLKKAVSQLDGALERSNIAERQAVAIWKSHWYFKNNGATENGYF